MKQWRFTLLSDGSSDVALIPPLTWLLHEKLPSTPIQIEWADLGRFPKLPRGLAGRTQVAIDFYPCDILLIHRDAETETREKRVAEIQNALGKISGDKPHVCVVPVRMQETWMLIDEAAIRSASGNPNGVVALRLPKLTRVENLPDPKTVLHELLRIASELTGRRLKKFSASASARRVAELVGDWTPLRKLPAFVAFEAELDHVLAKAANGEPRRD